MAFSCSGDCFVGFWGLGLDLSKANQTTHNAASWRETSLELRSNFRAGVRKRFTNCHKDTRNTVSQGNGAHRCAGMMNELTRIG